MRSYSFRRCFRSWSELDLCKWALIPVDKLVAESDLIVVGTS